MALFNDDVQQYLTLLNQISQQTFDTQYAEGMKYIKDHFAARGLSASGQIQDAMQTYLGKHTSALSLAKTRNAALAWQLQTGRNTQQQQQDWYEKQQQNALRQDGSVSDAMAIQNAMDDQSDWFNNQRDYPMDEGFMQSNNSRLRTGDGGKNPYTIYSGGQGMQNVSYGSVGNTHYGGGMYELPYGGTADTTAQHAGAADFWAQNAEGR